MGSELFVILLSIHGHVVTDLGLALLQQSGLVIRLGMGKYTIFCRALPRRHSHNEHFSE